MTDRAYARISLDSLASGSISKQRASLSRVASADVVFYVDESVSGSKIAFAERPAGSKLLAELRRGDRVLVTKIDRAARNVSDLLALVELVESSGASIVFAEQNIDTAGPMGRFMLTLLGAVAELEANIIGERRRESLSAFRDEGRHAVGAAPFGLMSVENPSGRGLVLRPHPEQSAALRDAVRRLLDERVSMSQLASELGIYGTRLSRVLRNERLAGLWPTNRGARLDPDMAVFSLEEWQRLQRHLDSHPAKEWSPAEGIGAALECAVCGERLYRGATTRTLKEIDPKTGERRTKTYEGYRCRGVKHERDDNGALVAARGTVMLDTAEKYVEKRFLEAFGHLPVTETIEEESDVARLQALTLARARIDAARRAQDTAATEADELAADAAYAAARRELRAAESMPVTSFAVVRETGETFAELYARGGAARVDALRMAGRWIVSPGRLPIEQKISFEPDAERFVESRDDA